MGSVYMYVYGLYSESQGRTILSLALPRLGGRVPSTPSDQYYRDGLHIDHSGSLICRQTLVTAGQSPQGVGHGVGGFGAWGRRVWGMG